MLGSFPADDAYEHLCILTLLPSLVFLAKDAWLESVFISCDLSSTLLARTEGHLVAYFEPDLTFRVAFLCHIVQKPVCRGCAT